jgi:Bacterial DNA-binding protein
MLPPRVLGGLPEVSLIHLGRMKKPDIAKQLARRSRVSQAEAADRLDGVLHKILSDLRKGKEAVLPGLGKFKNGPDGRLAFERDKGKSHD